MKAFALLRKGFLILFGILVLGLVLVVIFGADTLFGRAIRTYGPPVFGQPVSFTEAELSVFSGNARVDHFRVGSDARPLLDVGRAQLDASTMAALGGRVHVQNAELVGAVLHLVVREDGTLAFDPGPPPPEVREQEPPPDTGDLPPAEERDLVQIAVEYWERYERYRDYYEQYGGLFGGGSKDDAPPPAERVRYPGKPAFVAEAQERARREGEKRGVFWMERASIEDFQWRTRDERTGEPLLPALERFGFLMEHVGTPPGGETMPAVLTGSGALQAGGLLDFRLAMSRTDDPSLLTFSARDLPLNEILHLTRKSLPFRVEGGVADLVTEDLAFAPESLRGSVRLELRGAEVLPKPDSPEVLGVSPREFCTLLNAALKEQPVAFRFVLGGTPTEPTWTIENETDLGDALGGAVKAEVERRAQEMIDEKTQELQDKAKEEIQNRLGDEIGEKAGEQIGDRLGDEVKKGLGGLLGGDKKKKDDDGR